MTLSFKKGDRVRCIHASYTGGGFTTGRIYTVREDYNEPEGSCRSLLIEEDDKGSHTNGWVPKNFELVNTTPSYAHSFSPGGHGNSTFVKPESILGTQVGGSHYTDCAIQPIEYIWANKLGFSEGNIVKYITRWRSKGGIKDLEKAKHHIALLIEHETAKATS